MVVTATRELALPTARGAGRFTAFSSVYPSLRRLSLYWFAYPGPSLRALVLYLEDLRKPFVSNAGPAVCILVIKTTCTWLVQDTVSSQEYCFKVLMFRH